MKKTPIDPKAEAVVNEYDDNEDYLEEITTDSGAQLSEPGALLAAEAELTPEVRKRKQTLTTGHKLKILQELRSGKTERDVRLKHRLTKSALALIVMDDSLQEVTNEGYVRGTKEMLAARFYQVADMALSFIDPQKLERLDANKLVVAAAIALDKARLLEGQSTENISFRNLAVSIHGTLDQLKERKARLLDILKDRTAPKMIEASYQTGPKEE